MLDLFLLHEVMLKGERERERVSQRSRSYSLLTVNRIRRTQYSACRSQMSGEAIGTERVLTIEHFGIVEDVQTNRALQKVIDARCARHDHCRRIDRS